MKISLPSSEDRDEHGQPLPRLSGRDLIDQRNCSAQIFREGTQQMYIHGIFEAFWHVQCPRTLVPTTIERDSLFSSHNPAMLPLLQNFWRWCKLCRKRRNLRYRRTAASGLSTRWRGSFAYGNTQSSHYFAAGHEATKDSRRRLSAIRTDRELKRLEALLTLGADRTPSSEMRRGFQGRPRRNSRKCSPAKL